MRSDARVDQAEGLRRLLVRNHAQVITVVAGKSGVGRTSTVINLAAALTHTGKRVLVLDENHAPNNVLGLLGLYAGYDLLDIVLGKCGLREAISHTGGFSVLSAARAMKSLAQLKQAERHHLENVLAEACECVDVMLVDAAMPAMNEVYGLAGQSEASLTLASEGSHLVVMNATASGITDSYALIKRLALGNACLQFHIVMNKVADERAAMIAFENMAAVARLNLATCLGYLGCIPCDDRLKRATRLGSSVIEAFPVSDTTQSYLGLSQKLLRLPARQMETRSGARPIIPNLASQISQPLRQHSKKVTHVVNC